MITTAYIRLDSPDPESAWRQSFLRSATLLVCRDQSSPAQLIVNGSIEREWPKPLDALRWMQQTKSRWIGYLSYDCGRWFESFDRTAINDLGLPCFVFARIFDETSPSPGTPGEGRGEGDFERRKPLDARNHPHPSPLPRYRERGSEGSTESTFTRPRYEAAVARAIAYIAAGDIFQVNLSQRFTVPTTESPHDVYVRLIDKSPAPYAAFLDFGDFAIASHSPELFLHVTADGRVSTKPIKGTRPRLPGMETELKNSVKDAAELNMIVDLERNDLGRVCEVGSVRVTQPRTIETFPSVHHGVATVEGILRPEVDFVDLLAATFPGGSITGAPKVRAMQIIDELEPVRRGPYCGAIGYLAEDGSMQFNIAIRTMTFKDGKAHINVGGGIVADSDLAAEYEETLVKAKAMFDAIGIERT